MKTTVTILILIGASFSQAAPVMTNATVEAMVSGGVPVPVIVRSIRTAKQIDLYMNKETFARLLSVGASDAMATEIFAAIKHREYSGVDIGPETPAAVQVPVAVVAPVQAPPVQAPVAVAVVAPIQAPPVQVPVAVETVQVPVAVRATPAAHDPVLAGQKHYAVEYDGGSLSVRAGTSMKMYIEGNAIIFTQDDGVIASAPITANMSVGADFKPVSAGDVGLAVATLGWSSVVKIGRQKSILVNMRWNENGQVQIVQLHMTPQVLTHLRIDVENITGKNPFAK